MKSETNMVDEEELDDIERTYCAEDIAGLVQFIFENVGGGAAERCTVTGSKSLTVRCLADSEDDIILKHIASLNEEKDTLK